MYAAIGAMDQEAKLIKSRMTKTKETSLAQVSVTSGKFQGVEIALAQSGIGKINATICTQMLIDLFDPKGLLFTGVAGGLLPNMKTCDTIVASHVVQYDMDLTAFDRRHGEVPGRDRLIECNPDLVAKAPQAFDAAFESVRRAPNLMLGTIASGDRFVQDKDVLRWLQREFSALATEMEGSEVSVLRATQEWALPLRRAWKIFSITRI
ncbi:MAG: 5'-methylthioadenosine/S-adenosylhomocysteine nucleosidase [Rhodospirillaceae bacterium]